MEADQILATGGASGISAMALFLVYRFFFSKHKIRSNCCGKEMSIETNSSEQDLTKVENPVKISVEK
jgi:hypothetical protein